MSPIDPVYIMQAKSKRRCGYAGSCTPTEASVFESHMRRAADYE
jgi:hypothetical protein